MASNLYLTNAIVYDFVCSEEYDYGNNYDGTTFVAPVNGLYEFRFEGFLRPAGASLLFNYLRVRFTGSALLYAPYVYGGSRDNTYGYYHTFWSGTLTNNQIVKVAVNGVAGYTNLLHANLCFFEGKLIRALP